ncbi:unnamed protein product [Urochloa humidicola]
MNRQPVSSLLCSKGKMTGEDEDLCLDGTSPISRSSVTHVAYIVGKFNQAKQDLVREIGFHGILELPQIAKVDRKFTMWLLTKLNPETKCIVVNDQEVTDVNDFEVARIMGIPCGNKCVCPLDGDDRKSKLDFVRNCIGAKESETNGLVAAGLNVTKDYSYPMSVKEIDTFKVSFVVWVMGHLLAPTKKHNVGGDGFWGALKNPDEIKLYNWSAFVLDELFSAARDLQDELKQKKTVSCITGCSILLQILYFDNLNMGSLNTSKHILPRIKAYDSKTLTLMIAADKACSASSSENAVWGSTVVRPRVNVAKTIHHTDKGPLNEIDHGHELISDFGRFVRETFGDKMTPGQCTAFNWFHARCVHHLHQLRINIQQDTIGLLDKLYSGQKGKTASSTLHAAIPRSNPQGYSLPKVKDARPAQSEPVRRMGYGQTILNHKRPSYHTLSASNHYASRKKYRSTSRNYPYVETIISGGFCSETESVPDQVSDTDGQANINIGASASFEPTANKSPASSSCHVQEPELGKGVAIEPPSFDLGIDMEEDGENVATKAIVPVSHKQIYTNLVEPETPATAFSTLAGTPASAKNIEPHTMFTTPDQRIRNSTTSPRTLSKLMAEGEIVARITDLEDNFNINMKPWDEDFTDSPINKRVVDIGCIPNSPWCYSYTHRELEHDIVDNLVENICSCDTTKLESPWIFHTEPREIQVYGSWIKSVFCLDKPMIYDICDLAVRRLKQLDQAMYQSCPDTTWRHILESDFAMLAIAGEDTTSRKSIRSQFTGKSVTYKIEQCRMIIVPACVLHNWCCYFFDFKDRCVHVVDPLFSEVKRTTFEQIHSPNVPKIAAELANTIELLFDNWNHSIAEWEMKYTVPPITDARSDESGLLSLFYIREFDGCKFHNASRECFSQFKKNMLYELMCLENNQVKPPINFTISLD